MSAVVQLCGKVVDANQGAKMEIPLIAPEGCLLTVDCTPLVDGKIAFRVFIEVTDNDMRALQALAKEAA